ncbi:hypothetical protein V8E53_000847 [Lactarius tabidus]
MYSPVLGRSPNQHLALPPNETSLTNELQRPFNDPCSLSDHFSGPHTQGEVPDVFTVEVNSIPVDDSAPGFDFSRFDTDTPQSHDQTVNESRAITNTVTKSSDCQQSIPDTRFPIMPFHAKPFPDDCSCSQLAFNCLIRGATRGPSTLQDENQVPQAHGEDEHLVTFVPKPPSQLCSTPRDQGTSIEKMAKEMHQCSSCCVSFSQSQGLTRHNKDKHEPKKRCDFCEEFTWPRGRRYVYRRHLLEVHPDEVVSPSMRETLIACNKGVKFKGRKFRRSSVGRHTQGRTS